MSDSHKNAGEGALKRSRQREEGPQAGSKKRSRRGIPVKRGFMASLPEIPAEVTTASGPVHTCPSVIGGAAKT